jgi:putative ABC transport system permease protein
VRVEERRGGLRGTTPWTVTNGTYHAWTDAATTVEGIGAWRSTRQTLQNAGDPERVSVTAATPRLFSVLRARPETGRLFVEEDAIPGERAKAILSFGLWQRRFGGDRGVIGRTIHLDETTFDIVGVMPREFAFPWHWPRRCAGSCPRCCRPISHASKTCASIREASCSRWR